MPDPVLYPRGVEPRLAVPDWQRDLIRERLAALDLVRLEERAVPWEAVRKSVFSDRT